MRNLFKSSMFIAVAAMAFAGCTKEDTGNVSEATGNKITVNANAYAPETETRTVIGDKTEQGTRPVYWNDENEALAIVEFADNTRGAAIKTGEYTLSEDKKNANFQFELTENTSATAFDYYALYPYSVWSEDILTTTEYITLRYPSVQTPSAASADPNASVLFAKDMGHSVQPTTLNFSFKHVAAYGKMTITGLPMGSGEVVKSVTFSSPDKILAGTYRYYHETPESSSVVGTNTSNSITANVEALAINGTQDFTVWFACLPTTIDATFSVSVQTDANIYTREVTVPSDRPLEFVAGQVSTFGVDMSSVAVAGDYSGDYVIMVRQSNNYYALSSIDSKNKTRLDAVQFEYNGTDESVTTGNTELIWTITKNGSSYTLSNGGKYLSWPGEPGSKSGDNEAVMSETEYLLNINPNDDGTYAITSNDDSSRYLAKNSTVDNMYFAFYKGQTNNLYLVPATYAVWPTISADVTEVSLEYNDETAHEFNVTVSDATSVVAAAYDDAEGMTECSWLIAEYAEGKVTYMAEANNTDAERSAYIIVTATNENGSRKLTIPVNQAKEISQGEYTVTWAAQSGAMSSQTGTISTGDFAWDYTRSSVSYTGWQSGCIQLGKKDSPESVTFTTNNIQGIIKSVSVDCASYNSAHKITITVGDVIYLEKADTPRWSNNSTGVITGTGTSSGEIKIEFTDGSRAMYIKSISVTYEN